jgi:hypothetical protein
MKRVALVLSLSVLTQLTACSSMQDDPAQAQATQSCHEDADTGSRISHKTCRAPMTDTERTTAQSDLARHGQPSRN